MLGKENDMWYWFNPALMGNKIVAISGNLSLYGVSPATTWTYLQAIAYPGDETIIVTSSSGWKVGDQLLLGPSFSQSSQHEVVNITAINGNTIDFEPPLKYTHFGDTKETINNNIGILDTRNAVGHITRNIKFISGGEDPKWGYWMEIFSENDGEVQRRGRVTLSGVEFHTGGQYNA